MDNVDEVYGINNIFLNNKLVESEIISVKNVVV